MSTLDARSMEGAERLAFLATVRRMTAGGELTLGQALRALRALWLNLDRARFAQMVRVSERALAQIETDQANPTLQTLNQVFRPFGMQVGLVPLADPDQQALPLSEVTYEALRVAIREGLARRPRGRRT